MSARREETSEEMLTVVLAAWPASPDADRHLGDVEGARQALRVLRRGRSAEAVGAWLAEFLQRAVAQAARDVVPSSAEAQLTGACLSMLAADSEVPLSPRLAVALVATLNPGYWYRPLTPFIAARLDKTSLVEALTVALDASREPGWTCFALDGVRLYSTVACTLRPMERHASALGALRGHLERLASNADADLARAANKAMKHLECYG